MNLKVKFKETELIKVEYQQQALDKKCRACKKCKFVYSRPLFGLFDP
jgi:hypothetical protein